MFANQQNSKSVRGCHRHDFFNVLAVSILLPIELIKRIGIAKWVSELLVGSANRMEKPGQKWVKEPVGWLKDMWDQFGASGNVKGALMVATGLAIVLVALALVTRNMKALVARIEDPSTRSSAKPRTSN